MCLRPKPTGNPDFSTTCHDACHQSSCIPSTILLRDSHHRHTKAAGTRPGYRLRWTGFPELSIGHVCLYSCLIEDLHPPSPNVAFWSKLYFSFSVRHALCRSMRLFCAWLFFERGSGEVLRTRLFIIRTRGGEGGGFVSPFSSLGIVRRGSWLVGGRVHSYRCSS